MPGRSPTFNQAFVIGAIRLQFVYNLQLCEKTAFVPFVLLIMAREESYKRQLIFIDRSGEPTIGRESDCEG